jgi:rhizosphere induced protein
MVEWVIGDRRQAVPQRKEKTRSSDGGRPKIAVKYRKESVVTQYSLNVINNSQNLFDMCVYQKPPDMGVTDVFSLAWFSLPAQPATSVKFQWSIDYSFVWDATGMLQPGVTFDASQVVAADPSDTAQNAVTFDYPDGAYKFDTGQQGPASGHLYIYESKTIPADQASVGIGMSGSGTFAVQAQPNLNLVFTPDPSYWITAGTFVQGQVLDIETVTNPAEIVFPENVYSMTATLGQNNAWSVTPTAQTNIPDTLGAGRASR